MKKHDVAQGTPEWLQIRKGKITGTMLSAIMSPRKRPDAMWEFIAQKLSIGVDEGFENPMDRGNRLEAEAVAAFEFATGLTTERVGFVEHDEEEAIANSPDRHVVGKKEAVEVKCPGGKNYVKGWLTDVVPDDYQWQVVQYFVVDPELEKVYFVLYNPDIPSHPLHIIEVERSSIEKEIADAMKMQKESLAEANKKLKGLITI